MKTTVLFLMLAASSVMAGNGNNKANKDNDNLPNGKPFQNLQEQIDVMTMQIGDMELLMQERVDGLQSRLDSLAVQVEANSGNITLLEEQQEVQDELIATLIGSVAELAERVTQNQDDVQDALDLLESTLDSAVTAIDSRLYALEGDIEALGDDIDTNTNHVALNAAAILRVDMLLQEKEGMLRDAIDAVTSVVDANTASISNLESDLSATRDELVTKQQRVTQVCSPGYSIRAIAEDGTVSCEADDSTAVLTSYTYSRSATRYTSSNRYAFYGAAYCPSTYTMTGGGFYKSSYGMNVRYSRPRGNTGWEVYSFYTTSYGSVYVYARCIRSI